MNRVIDLLNDAGYEHEGDLGIPTREAFRPRDGSDALLVRAHHLYACETSSSELRRHLAFRDYLIAQPERAGWLAERKRLADGASNTRDTYIQTKAEAYEQIAAEAEER